MSPGQRIHATHSMNLPEATKPSRLHKRKKRRSEKATPSSAAEGTHALAPDRPPFALGFPDDPQLMTLLRAFERGNYAFVRSQADRLIRSASEPAVRQAALELRRRLDPDPLAKLLLAIAFGLLLFLVIWTYGHVHAH